MKKTIIITTILITVFLSACAYKNSGPVNSPGKNDNNEPPEEDVFIADQMYYDEEPDVNIVIFAADDWLFIQKSGNTEWERLVSDNTGEIYLRDFEFAEAEVDLTLLTGGEEGFYQAPRIDTVHDHKTITFYDVVDRGLIEEYEPGTEYFDCVQIYKTDDHLFCIVHTEYNEYRLYSDCEFVGAYETLEEVEPEMGL